MTCRDWGIVWIVAHSEESQQHLYVSVARSSLKYIFIKDRLTFHWTYNEQCLDRRCARISLYIQSPCSHLCWHCDKAMALTVIIIMVFSVQTCLCSLPHFKALCRKQMTNSEKVKGITLGHRKRLDQGYIGLEFGKNMSLFALLNLCANMMYKHYVYFLNNNNSNKKKKKKKKNWEK